MCGTGVPHTDLCSRGTFKKAPSISTTQNGFTMSRLSMFALMSALVSGSVYATPPRSVETQSRSSRTQPAETRPAETRPAETELSLETIEKRCAIAEARRAVGSQLRDNS